jgi:RNA recognition motif-containing protein
MSATSIEGKQAVSTRRGDPQRRTVFVGQIPASLAENKIKRLFRPYGKIVYDGVLSKCSSGRRLLVSLLIDWWCCASADAARSI